jgi:GntR family transcriptional repressor for pyruvate dehydrogenase complex
MSEATDNHNPGLEFQIVEARVSLSRQVADQLEAMILDGRIGIGEKLPTENALCGQFGVSRTVVREAVAKIKSLGLVETRRGIGSTVIRNAPADKPFYQSIDPTEVQDILHVLEFRMAIEESAAELAALRRDESDIAKLEQIHSNFHQARAQSNLARSEDLEFHLAIAAATKNPMINGFFEQFTASVIPRAKLVKQQTDQTESDKYLQRVEAEHRAIVDAIIAGDAQAARQAMHLHLSRAYALYESYQDEQN